MRNIVFGMSEHTNCLSSTECSALIANKLVTSMLNRLVIFRNICIGTYYQMYATIINLKEFMNLRENKEGYMREFGGMKGKVKII